MQIKWNKPLKTIRTEFHDGTHLDWSYDAWSMSKEDFSEDTFRPINNWWSSRPIETREVLKNYIFEIYEILYQNHISIEEMATIKSIIYKIFLMYGDWNSFKEWCIPYINLTNGIKTELKDNHTRELTYFTEDYLDICCFTICLKTFMPILGMYYFNVNKILGADTTFINGLKLMYNQWMLDSPAMVKLMDYCTVSAEDKLTNNAYIVLKNIPTIEVPEYLAAVAIWKKVITYNCNDSRVNIVTNIYSVINEKIGAFLSTTATIKKNVDSDGGDVGMNDKYWISETISTGIIRATEYYITRCTLAMVYAIKSNSEITQVEIDTLVKTLIDNEYTPLKTHIGIFSLISKDVLSIKIIDMLKDKTKLSITTLAAVCALLLKESGYSVLYDTIISTKEVKDTTGTIMSGKIYIQIPSKYTERLNHIYRYAKDNIWSSFIDSYVLELNRFNLTPNVDLSNIKVEMAELLIRGVGAKDESND